MTLLSFGIRIWPERRVAQSCPPARRPERSERGAHLAREELGLLPRREVAALLDLVEVGERGVGLLDPAARGRDDLPRERGESDRNRDRRRRLTGRTSCGFSPPSLPAGAGRA